MITLDPQIPVQKRSLSIYNEIIDKWKIDINHIDINDFISFINHQFYDLLALDYKSSVSKQMLISKLTHDLEEMYYFLYRDDMDIPSKDYVVKALNLLTNEEFVSDLVQYYKQVMLDIERS